MLHIGFVIYFDKRNLLIQTTNLSDSAIMVAKELNDYKRSLATNNKVEFSIQKIEKMPFQVKENTSIPFSMDVFYIDNQLVWKTYYKKCGSKLVDIKPKAFPVTFNYKKQLDNNKFLTKENLFLPKLLKSENNSKDCEAFEKSDDYKLFSSLINDAIFSNIEHTFINEEYLMAFENNRSTNIAWELIKMSTQK